MSDADSISAAMDAVPEKGELLLMAYQELESHTSALVNFKTQWKELQDHFDKLEELMNKRSQELGIKLDETKVRKSQIDAQDSSPAEAKKGSEKTTKKSTDVKLSWKFKTLCEKMDAEGLLNFLVDKLGEHHALRKEAPGALKSAPNPAEIVLKALEGFHTEKRSMKQKTVLKRKRARVLLLKTLPAVVKAEEMSADVKEKAKKLAGEWKVRVERADGRYLEACNTRREDARYLEAHAFMQLLICYGLVSEFKDVSSLVDLVVVAARGYQAPEVCRILGLQDNLTDIVEKMISSGKHIEAVNIIHTFGLTEKYPLVPLLKAYLEDAKKLSQDTAKSGNIHQQNEGASKEIAAVKAVIQCIQQHKLELQMSPDNLQTRVAQLEKAKADRKRSAAESVKSQTKWRRVSSGRVLSPASAAEKISTICTSSIAAERSPLCPGMTSYILPTPGAYNRSSQSILGSPIEIGSRGTIPPSRSHLFPSDDLSSSLYGAGSFGAPSAYGSFSLGAGLPSANASYPTVQR